MDDSTYSEDCQIYLDALPKKDLIMKELKKNEIQILDTLNKLKVW